VEPSDIRHDREDKEASSQLIIYHLSVPKEASLLRKDCKYANMGCLAAM